MANSKITALTELTSVAGGDLVAIVDDPSGTPTSKKITKANLVKNIAVSDLANGTDGELITWNSSGVASAVPVGTATNVLTSNGAGQAPTFQAAGGGGDIPDVLYDSTYKTGTGIDTVASSSIDTFGSWTELFSNIGTGKKILGLFCKNGSGGAGKASFEIEIGEGASGSESTVSRISGYYAGSENWEFPLNRTVTNNVRIAVRVREGNTNANSWKIGIIVATA